MLIFSQMNFGGIFRANITRYGLSLAAVLLLTAVLISLGTHVNTTTMALGLLLVVLASATFFGRNPALVASFVAMLCLNYFLIPPIRSWTIADPQNLVAWAAFTVTAIIGGELSAYARRRALEAERLYKELQEAFAASAEAEAVRQSEKLKSALLEAVTHDLRTPLTSIKASVTTLLESEGGHRTIELTPEGRAEFLDIINEETDRLNGFIEGIVELARVEAGSSAGPAASADVEEVINAALTRADRLSTGHQFSVRIETSLPTIRADARAIAEVIYNLVENAAKYSPINTAITIEARRAGNDIVISVNDEGPGVPEEMRERVFEKFVRGANDPGGLGLGLAIARGITEAQNGRIHLETGDNGVGTKAVLTMPAEI